jgi:hypothetical protein
LTKKIVRTKYIIYIDYFPVAFLGNNFLDPIDYAGFIGELEINFFTKKIDIGHFN